jgi:2-polyprenyl-6-methoxyphenol hydroxylase-like FAD-dependent oxidoreductase
VKVLIVGAGIGGMAVGIALRRAGHDVAIFERRADLSEIQIGGGIILWSNAVRALQQLEIADAVLDVALPVTRADNCSSDGKVLFEIPVNAFEQRLGAPSVTISRAKLHPVLETALGKDAIQVNKECTGFTQDASSVTAHFADGTEERGDFLVAADGRNSALRKQLGRAGNDFPPYAGWTHYSGIARGEPDQVPEGLFRIITGKGAQAYLFWIEPSVVYWAVGVYGPPGVRGREYDPASKPLIEGVVAGWAEPLPGLVRATDAATVARRDMHGGQPLQAWGEGRVTLLGDSAHPMTTTPGQGACTAIEDAAVLARCLRQQQDVALALRAYETAQMERAANWMSVSRTLESRVNVTSPVRVWIRNQIMSLALGRLGLFNRSTYYKEMMRLV